MLHYLLFCKIYESQIIHFKHCIQVVSKKFGEWYQKTNKTEDTNKLNLLAFKIIAILHNTLSATFIKLLETVSKGLFRNFLQNRCHTFLDCYLVYKTCAFHDALHAGKQNKSAGARSGEYSGWSRTGTPLWAKNWCTRIAQCAGALSRSNIHCPVLCNSGQTWWMRCSNRFKTSS